MKRGYTSLEYRSIIRRLRKAKPGDQLSSDFIVGFPGETEADFDGDARARPRAAVRRLVLVPLQPAPGHARGGTGRPGAAGARSSSGCSGCRRSSRRRHARSAKRWSGRFSACWWRDASKQGSRGTGGTHRQQPHGEFRRRRRAACTASQTCGSPTRGTTRCAANCSNAGLEPGSRVQRSIRWTTRASRGCAARWTRTCARSRRRSMSRSRAAARASRCAASASRRSARRGRIELFYDQAADELTIDDVQLGLAEISPKGFLGEGRNKLPAADAPHRPARPHAAPGAVHRRASSRTTSRSASDRPAPARPISRSPARWTRSSATR